MPRRRALVVASNRLPVQRSSRGEGEWERSPGGLVTAMESVVAERGALWLGWDGTPGRAPRKMTVGNLRVRGIALTKGQADGYYHGFCNRTLWPLYHDAVSPPEFHRAWWKPYEEVNRKFADVLARAAPRSSLVWIHDYHLQLAPRMLRELRPDLKIGFFLHIPFPPEELFAWLPWRSAILRGILGADVVGFQTEASSTNFARLARRYSLAEGTDRELQFNGRTIRVLPSPISVDAEKFGDLAASPEVQRKAREIRIRLGNRKIILSVDRLDYTKGIPARLHAIEELLSHGSISSSRVVHVQIAVPSRENLPGYQAVRREVEEMVGRINGEHSEPGSVAVHYFRRSLAQDDLTAWYLAADVMLVTPLRDGMNLVAKEYAACRTNLDGALVLSEFAGAARELRRALLVNPRDIDVMKSTIVQALKLPPRDKKMRMAILRQQVRRHTVHDWSQGFLSVLEDA